MTSQKEYRYVLPIGTILQGGLRPYRVVQVLGQGGFGITYKVTATIRVGNVNVPGTFAVKEHFIKGKCKRGKDGVSVDYAEDATDEIKESEKDFISEGKLLTRICRECPNIVNVNEVFEVNNTAYYVMEFLDGGNLRDLVKKVGGGVTEEQAMALMQPIARALDFLHSNNILHLDVKPENIVIRSGTDSNSQIPVLIDFGVSLHFNNKGNLTSTHSMIGVSKGFSPIEQYALVKKFSPKLDIYALAATWYFLLVGRDPEDAFEITTGVITQSLPSNISTATKKAILTGMRKDKDERPATISQFLALFQDRYTLPVGFLLKGRTCNYRIVEVEDNNDENHVIRYRAIRQVDDSITQSYAYTVYEYFVRGEHKRGDDEAVVMQHTMVENDSWKKTFLFTMVKKTHSDTSGFFNSENDISLTNDIPDWEYLSQNCTCYCVIRKGWKKPRQSLLNMISKKTSHTTKTLEKSLLKSVYVIQQHIKIIILSLCTLILATMVVFAYPIIKERWYQWQTEHDEGKMDIGLPHYPNLADSIEKDDNKEILSSNNKDSISETENQIEIQTEDKHKEDTKIDNVPLNNEIVKNEPSDDQILKTALSQNDWATVEQLGKKGVNGAADALAQHYVNSDDNLENNQKAEMWANKASPRVKKTVRHQLYLRAYLTEDN